MKKKIFNPKVGDWLVNNLSTYVVLRVDGCTNANDDEKSYDLELKNVTTGWRFLACNVEQLEDYSVTWLMTLGARFDKPVNLEEFDAPLIQMSDNEIVEHILHALTRYTRLSAEAEYWFTQTICAADETEKRRSDGFFQMCAIDAQQEKHKTRVSLLTEDKAGFFPDRFKYLWNKAVGICVYYAVERAKAMREANGIFSDKGVVKYRFFEEDTEE